MIVKDNARAKEMATYFHDGHPEYQEDPKWWELVEEADRELLYGPAGKPALTSTPMEAAVPHLRHLALHGRSPSQRDCWTTRCRYAATPRAVAPASPTPPQRREIPSLSRKYIHQRSGASWNVTAFEVEPGDPDLPEESPWIMLMADIATRNYHLLYDPNHPVFSSITMTPRDGLLTQLSWMTGELLRTTKEMPSLGKIVSDFRREYGDDSLLILERWQATHPRY